MKEYCKIYNKFKESKIHIYSYPEITERIVAIQGLKFIIVNYLLIKDLFSEIS